MASGGFLGIAGIAALIGGGLLLFDTGDGGPTVSPWVAIPVAIVLGGGLLLVGGRVLAARRQEVRTGEEELRGALARVRTAIDPIGQVFVEGALWRARSADGNPDRGRCDGPGRGDRRVDPGRERRRRAGRRAKLRMMTTMSLRGAAVAAAAALLPIIAAALPSPAAAQAEQKVPSIELRGDLSPAQADWIGHALGDAADAGAPFAIVRLDTPGGIDSAAEEIVDQIRSAPIPVVVYVYPGGAEVEDRGASIVDAGDVAAMAPGTTLESEGNGLGENTALKQGRIEMIASDQETAARGARRLRGQRPEVGAAQHRRRPRSTTRE